MVLAQNVNEQESIVATTTPDARIPATRILPAIRSALAQLQIWSTTILRRSGLVAATQPQEM